MDDNAPDRRLSQLSTGWTTLFRALDRTGAEGNAALTRLLERYGTPVYRYLRAAVREPEAADEMYQEFALRLVRGDFRNACPDRGRFRDFLRVALSNLITDHRRRQTRRPNSLNTDDLPSPSHEPIISDEEFVAGWREEMLARAWDDLDKHERETGQPVYVVLKSRAEHPNVRSANLAQQLASKFGRPVSAEWVRKWLQKARDRFANTVVTEVAGTLDPATPDALAEELIDLGLMDYCREALDRFRQLPTQ